MAKNSSKLIRLLTIGRVSRSWRGLCVRGEQYRCAGVNYRSYFSTTFRVAACCLKGKSSSPSSQPPPKSNETACPHKLPPPKENNAHNERKQSLAFFISSSKEAIWSQIAVGNQRMMFSASSFNSFIISQQALRTRYHRKLIPLSGSLFLCA